LAEGVHFFFVGLFTQIEGDFVGVEFLRTIGLRFSALFFAQGAFFPGALDLGFLGAEFGAGGEISQTLKGEKLMGGVLAGGGEVVSGGHDDVVDFFGRGFIAGLNLLEVGQRKFLAGIEAEVDAVERDFFVTQAFERAA
jgi:hypothetical protein